MELLVYLDHVLSQFWQAQGRSEFVRDVEGVGKNIEMVVVVAGGRHLPVKLAGAAWHYLDGLGIALIFPSLHNFDGRAPINYFNLRLVNTLLIGAIVQTGHLAAVNQKIL